MFRRKRDETPNLARRQIDADSRYVHNRIERVKPAAATKLYRTIHRPASRRALNGIVGH